MNLPYLLGLSIASIVFFVLYVVFSIFNYKKRFNKSYDLRNTFPYEFNYGSSFKENVLGNIFLIMSCLFSLGLFAFSGSIGFKNGFVIAAMAAGIIYALAMLLVVFIPLKYLKTHIVFAALLMIAAFSLPVVVGLGVFQHYQNEKDILSLIIAIACFVVGLFSFAISMNPKLSLNFKMQVATDDKGNEYYVRPKYIMFAFTEWMTTLILFISQILLVIVLYIIL